MSKLNWFVDDYCLYRKNLPEWFKRPSPCEIKQMSLFAREPAELNSVLAALSISVDDLVRWHREGWVSFGSSEAIDRIEKWHINELLFVRDIARSGLSDAQIKVLLEDLPRPMNFDPTQVAYSFSLGWVQAMPEKEPDLTDYMEGHLDEWLEELAANDLDRLVVLKDQIDSMINIANDGSKEAGATNFPKDEE